MWNDYRLKIPADENDYPLILDIDWKKKLWVPDVYFKNSRQSTVLEGSLSAITFLEVHKNRNVSLVARVTVKLTCDMQLFAYPHDQQQCFLESTSREFLRSVSIPFLTDVISLIFEEAHDPQLGRICRGRDFVFP